MEILSTHLQVNEFARRNRHIKIFSRGGLIKIQACYFLAAIVERVKSFGKNAQLQKLGHFFIGLKTLTLELIPIAPQKKLLFQGLTVGLGALLISSFTINATFTATNFTYASDYIEGYSLPGNVLVADEDGYLVKINPQTDESSRIGLTDLAVHTVEKGESLSVIGEKYGVKVETIMWQNNLVNANTIRVGQTLLISPVDGISYKVASADNLEKIAKKYNVSVESIVAQNNLESEVINKGQTLFLPNAKPIAPPVIVGNTRNPAIGRNTRSASSAQPSTSSPSAGKIFIFPTSGKITQGFRGGHYALDIADRSMPPVWSAGAGTVVKASTGTWGNGYGNHVIIDHGNGIQTLYGHLDSVNVYEGQYVNQGDVIGIMGNTGRVYGVTGIHVHWEVIDNGVKRNPYNYF